MEMLDDRKLEVTLVMSEAHMGRQLKDNGLEYELDQRVLQAVADLGREVSPHTSSGMGWSCRWSPMFSSLRRS